MDEWPEISAITVSASIVRNAFQPFILLNAPEPLIIVLPLSPNDERVKDCREFMCDY